MPQIWLNYEELADFLGCEGPAAANFSAAAHWPRRRCSDGITRAKLPSHEAEAFLRHYFFRRSPSAQADQLVAALETVLRAAQRPHEATPRASEKVGR